MKDGCSMCFELACWLCRDWSVILTMILPCVRVYKGCGYELDYDVWLMRVRC
jgi:hypothetical protein